MKKIFPGYANPVGEYIEILVAGKKGGKFPDMNGLREKFRNKKGFTLIEMLIVVAIIAILIAISIPMVGSALESSRHAVDDANERDAISLATVAYLTGKIDGTDGKMTDITWKADGTVELYYVVGTAEDGKHQGQLLADKSNAVEPACKCGERTAGTKLTVTITQATGKVKAEWKSAT